MKSIIYISALIFISSACLHGQYLGGQADGSDLGKVTSLLNVHVGGQGDGFNIGNYKNNKNIFKGGLADGYNIGNYKNNKNIFKGGLADGFNIGNYKNNQNIFKGGLADGYNIGNYKNDKNIFKGGQGDGYDSQSFILDFIWTGVINNDWSEPGNWNTSLVPDITRRVFIPQVNTNYPFLNKQWMSIGDDTVGADYVCRVLVIQQGASMTLSSLTSLRNYGSMNISGSFLVSNIGTDAIVNLNQGVIKINKSGSLIIE